MADKPRCAIEGCNNNRMSKGNGGYHQYCTKHHREKGEIV